ncbi:MAG: endonuclease MutS2 [Gemmatimonadota bacterium]
MDAHTLSVLELARILDLVAGFASSGPGRRAVLARSPLESRAAAALELERVEEASRLLHPGAGFPFPEVHELEEPLRTLAVEGSVLEARPLLELGRTLRDARRVKKALLRREDLPQLQGQARTLVEERLLEERVLASFEEDGEVSDAASPDLRRLRAELRARRQEIKTRLERVLRGLARNLLTPDPTVTLREGRYVIPVLREAKSTLKGIVHDESASGVTIFVEPDAVIPLNNALRETELAVRREEQRILRQLTHLLRPIAVELGIAFAFLVDLDSLFARARFRAGFGAGRFVFDEEDRIVLRQARHPLLVASLQAGGRDAVPLDLELEPGERTLVVTGPNTGGKTVLLKTVGATALLAQSGVPPLVADGSAMPFFPTVFADIGDEQSIESSLSTFSAHMRTIVRTLEDADARSLVLLDELGVGTDPHEGVALASAVLDTLTRRGTRTLSTTHYGELKKLAASVPGMINGSLDFDTEHIQPRYRFRKGLPGRSYGLVIARALGLAETTIARAEGYLDREHLDVQRLTDELGRRAQDLDARAAELAGERVRAERDEAEAERRLQEKEAHLERDFQDQVERLLNRQRELLRQVRARLQRLGEEERQREILEELRRELAASRATLDAARRSAPTGAPGFAVGDEVELAGLGVRGEVVEVLPARGEVVVRAGGKRLQVPAAELAPVAAASPRPAAGRVAYQDPDESPDEVDLRGLTADEIEVPLTRGLDVAVSAGRPWLRVIHGKGGGVLRERVRAHLAADRRVRSFRAGLWHEGGSGVTLAELA